MLKISGTCAISKDPTNGNLKLEFAKTQNGADVVKGSLYWLNSSKDKTAPKTYSNIKFVGYKDMVNFFRDNCHELIEIKDCPIRNYSGKRKDGTSYYGYEITVFNAAVYQKKELSQSFNEPKESKPEFFDYSKEDEDFPIPF